MTAGQKAVELATMMAHMGTKVDEASRRTSVLDALCADDVLELPLCEDPPSKAKGNLKVDLLKHQVRTARCAAFFSCGLSLLTGTDFVWVL